MNTTHDTTNYQATCTCGYKGRKYRDGNAAIEAAENHAAKYVSEFGGRSDGRRHRTDVVEAKI